MDSRQVSFEIVRIPCMGHLTAVVAGKCDNSSRLSYATITAICPCDNKHGLSFFYLSWGQIGRSVPVAITNSQNFYAASTLDARGVHRVHAVANGNLIVLDWW